MAKVLDEKLVEIAHRFDTPEYLVRAVCLLHRKKPSSCAYWQRWNHLHHLLAGKFHLLMTAVRQALQQTPRASSLVENLNSRLLHYFFLRRQLGPQYLGLLRFFLNHRTFMRSECPERVGKSPTQLMTGQPNAHWLELLGFERFQRAKASHPQKLPGSGKYVVINLSSLQARIVMMYKIPNSTNMVF